MGIGAYRHRVTLEHPAVVLDPVTWDCALSSAASQVVDGLSAYFVRGRYHPGITLETQINFEGRTFQVQSVTDVEERHAELQLMCVEVVGRSSGRGAVQPVTTPPTITTPPVGSTIASGASVTLTVVATGPAPLTYQWTTGGVVLVGATHDFYVTGPLTVTTSYAVTVANAYGAVTSTPVTVTVTVPTVQTYQQRVVADGAVAYWPLDDPSGTTARDLVGTRHGVITGGVTLNQPGIGTSKCMGFPSSGLGKISLPSFPSLGTAFTLEAWVNRAGAPSVQFGIITRWLTTDGDFHWKVQGLTNTIRFHYYSGGHFPIDFPAVIPLTIWTHVILVGDGSQVTQYINGIAGTSQALTLNGTGSGLSALGGSMDTGTETWGWVGSLQDFACYPHALTAAEIVAHYALRIS